VSDLDDKLQEPVYLLTKLEIERIKAQAYKQGQLDMVEIQQEVGK
jgi:hypothetical protein